MPTAKKTYPTILTPRQKAPFSHAAAVKAFREITQEKARLAESRKATSGSSRNGTRRDGRSTISAGKK